MKKYKFIDEIKSERLFFFSQKEKNTARKKEKEDGAT